MKIRQAALAAVFTLAGTAANAQLVVSGNDGHWLEVGRGPETLVPDSISVIDFSKPTPKLLGSVSAPASITGPPVGVAISRTGKFALVTADTKFDPADPMKAASNDALTVVDISHPTNPKITQSLHAGAGANGVAINHAETLALVANSGDHSISVYSISHGKLTDAGKVDLGDGVNASDVAFLPDGKSAVAAGGSNLIRLSVDGTKVAVAGPIAPVRGTNVFLTPDGRYAVVNGAPAAAPPAGAAPAAAGAARGARGGARGAGGAGGGAAAGGAPAAGRGGKVSLIDLSSGTVVAQGDMLGGAEGIRLSPDGHYLAATITNNSHLAPGAPGYADEYGIVQVFSVSDSAITPITDAHTGGWPQGAVFSRDDKTLLVQSGVQHDIDVFRFDGKTLTRDMAATVKLDADAGSIAEQPR